MPEAESAGQWRLKQEGRGEFEDRGSRFLGYAMRIADEAGFEQGLQRVRSEHPKARHHCWAWRLADRYRFTDDGEPGGTAGRPILQVLEGEKLVRAAVVVVRYFGGVKLGTGGLVRAYTAAAQAAVRQAGKSFIESRFLVGIQLPYELSGLREELQARFPNLEWGPGEFGERGWDGRFSIEVSARQALEAFLRDKGKGRIAWEDVGTCDS